MPNKTCPKCGARLSFQEGGYEEFLGLFGTYDQVEFADCWYCPDCGYSEEIPEKSENKEYA